MCLSYYFFRDFEGPYSCNNIFVTKRLRRIRKVCPADKRLRDRDIYLYFMEKRLLLKGNSRESKISILDGQFAILAKNWYLWLDAIKWLSIFVIVTFESSTEILDCWKHWLWKHEHAWYMNIVTEEITKMEERLSTRWGSGLPDSWFYADVTSAPEVNICLVPDNLIGKSAFVLVNCSSRHQQMNYYALF